MKIILNGKELIAKEGSTILEVAQENGYKIPTLCHDEELKPFGSCWVCAVKVEGRRGFVTSCGTTISEGMKIDTESDNVKSARKMALELLLSDHFADCEAPCKIACPADVDVQSYVSLIANGQNHEAVRVIKDKLPMPLSIGRVCPAFCEEECRRQVVDESIAIRQLKRYCADQDLNDYWNYVPEKKEAKGKKVAIIGGGPSGLSCGYYLSTEGYEVKVFESMPKAGGWLRYGIPEYRLPKAILDQEIELMCSNGMVIDYNVKIGRDISFKEIKDSYDAVYLAIGAQDAVPMAVKGNDLKGCYLGVDFLRDYALGKAPELGKKVAVVGGGNTAIDCVRTATRLGAKATIIYRRAKAQMPAEDFEIEAAENEGVEFRLLTNPVEYLGDSGQLTHIKLEKMKLGQADSSGRRRPEPTGEFEVLEFDSVIAAISQKPNIDFLKGEANYVGGAELPFTRWNTLETPEHTMYTGLGNVFAGGDFRRGPATAVEAIGDGNTAGESIAKFLQEIPFEKPKYIFDSKMAKRVSELEKEIYGDYEKIDRAVMGEIEVEQAKTTFDEVEVGFTEEQAKTEAERCLECGCQVNSTCVLRSYASEYEVDQNIFGGAKNQHPIDDSHPFILRDSNKCINCGRCIRTCSEIQGAGVLGYIYRGFSTYVAPEFGESLTLTSCESCGKCIAVCPTGALLPKNINYKDNPLENNKIIQSCGMCGTGCDIVVDVHSSKIINIATPSETNRELLPLEYDENLSFNKRNLCYKGRFGWQALTTVVDNPLIKVADGFDEIEFMEIHNHIGPMLKDGFQIHVSANLSIEELLVASEVAKTKRQPITLLEEVDAFHIDILQHADSVVDKEKLESAENYIVVGEISQTLRTLIRLEQRKGKKLTLIDYPEIDFCKLADENLCCLEALGEYNIEKTIFVYNINNITVETAQKLWNIVTNIADFGEGSYIYPTSYWNNLRAIPFLETDLTKEDKAVDIYFGDLPKDYKKVKPTILISDVFNPEMDIDIFIPKASFLEIDAIALADDLRVKIFNKTNNSMKADLLVSMFAQMGFLPISMAEMANWTNRADDFIQSIELSDFDIKSLINNPVQEKPKVTTYRDDIVKQLKQSK